MADAVEKENIFLFVPNLIGKYVQWINFSRALIHNCAVEKLIFTSFSRHWIFTLPCVLVELLLSLAAAAAASIHLFNLVLHFIYRTQATHGSFWQLSHSTSCKAIILLLDGVTLLAHSWTQSMDMQRVHLIKVSSTHTSSHLIDLKCD